MQGRPDGRSGLDCQWCETTPDRGFEEWLSAWRAGPPWWSKAFEPPLVGLLAFALVLVAIEQWFGLLLVGFYLLGIPGVVASALTVAAQFWYYCEQRDRRRSQLATKGRD